MKLMTVELPDWATSGEFFDRIERALMEVPVVAVPWSQSDLHTFLWLNPLTHMGFSIGVARFGNLEGSLVEIDGVAFTRHFGDVFGLLDDDFLTGEHTCFVVVRSKSHGLQSDPIHYGSCSGLLQSWREQKAVQNAK